MSTTPARNVLVIAYYFPPMGLSGVQRTLKFVKYLPQYCWRPTVLTVTPTGYFAHDYTLLQEVEPHGIHVERVGSLDANRLFRRQGIVRMPSERWRKVLTFLSDSFFIPDNKIGWKRTAVAAAERLFEKTHFDIIFATAPPFTDFLIGLELWKRFKRPLVLDYRDPWIEYPHKYYPTPFHKMLNTRLERKVVHAASKIITTNRRVKELLLKRHKSLTYQDVVIIPQGYDPHDFQNGALVVERPKRMRITHAGVFYGDRSPKYFLRALKRIFDHRPELRSQIEACFVGNFQEEHAQIVRHLGLEDNVVITGYLDHARCVQHLLASDVLWLMLNNDRQSPGKVYEYLGARKPILACVPEGFMRQTLSETGASVVVNPDSIDGIVSGVLQFHRLYMQGQLPSPKEEVVGKFNRVELTGELSKVFGFLVE